MRFACLALVALLLVGCGGSTPGPSTTPAPQPAATPSRLTVQVTIKDTGRTGLISLIGATGCAGAGGYSDIGSGMQATVKDASGTILGIGNFGTGNVTQIIGRSVTECQLNAVVDKIPDATFYAVDLGRRGSVQFSRDQLIANGWIAPVSIGN